MWKIFIAFLIVTQCLLLVNLQRIYECNFDGSTAQQNCFDPPMIVVESVGKAFAAVPTAPLSDVTSSLRPTANGEVCRLPYQVANYTWQMYFCNEGYCPTANSLNSTCLKGKFGSIRLINFSIRSFRLKTESQQFQAFNDHCLTFYYYLSNVTENQINILTSDVDGLNETIDFINSSSVNGWIQRQVSFFASQSNFQIYFNTQKLAGASVPSAAFDEISLRQGECDDQPASSPFESTVEISTIFSPTASNIPTDSTQTTTVTSTSTTTALTTTTQTSLPNTTLITAAPETSQSTSTTMTPMITTSTTNRMSTLESTKETPSSSKTYIIILAAVIPVIGIAIGLGLWYKRWRSKSALGGVTETFTDISERRKTTLELRRMSSESSF